jgi:hypothetical protein
VGDLMRLRLLNIVSYTLLIANVFVNIYFVQELQPTSSKATIFVTTWLLIPQLVMFFGLLSAQRKLSSLAYWHIAIPLVTIAGVLFLVNVIFLNSDAQGGIAVIFTPIYQGFAMAILIPIVQWLSRNENP